MRKSEIIKAYYEVKALVCEYSTRQYVIIVESNNELVIGLHTPAEKVYVEDKSIYVSESLITFKLDNKPFTMKQLIRISKIWRELQQQAEQV